MTFNYLNDTGHFSDVENRNWTKILETVPNLDNFVGEPPHMEVQPPHAVADSNLNLHLDFPIFLFIFIYLLFHCFYLILICVSF